MYRFQSKRLGPWKFTEVGIYLAASWHFLHVGCVTAMMTFMQRKWSWFGGLPKTPGSQFIESSMEMGVVVLVPAPIECIAATSEVCGSAQLICPLVWRPRWWVFFCVWGDPTWWLLSPVGTYFFSSLLFLQDIKDRKDSPPTDCYWFWFLYLEASSQTSHSFSGLFVGNRYPVLVPFFHLLVKTGQIWKKSLAVV